MRRRESRSVCFRIAVREADRRHEAGIPTGLLTRQRRLHFLGVGGAGMSGIAELCQRLGFEVERLRSARERRRLRGSPTLGNRNRYVDIIRAIVAHVAELDAVDYLVGRQVLQSRSSGARALKIPVIARAEMLGELLRMARLGVAVAGTHGKTTTTSLVGLIMEEAGLRSDSCDRRKSPRARHQRAARARRFYGCRSRRERRFVSAAAADGGDRDQYRSRTSGSLRHDGSGARSLFEFHQPRTVLWASRCWQSTA